MALIAIVDDQITNRRIYSRLAASLVPGADVQSFADPIKALEWTKENLPDIVISDFQMGTMNGASFTAAFRAQKGCEDVPVIIVTAYEDKSFRYRALDAGATDFITSPGGCARIWHASQESAASQTAPARFAKARHANAAEAGEEHPPRRLGTTPERGNAAPGDRYGSRPDQRDGRRFQL